MNGSDLLAALDPVLAVLERLGVRHFVGGSVASSAHGMSDQLKRERTTRRRAL